MPYRHPKTGAWYTDFRAVDPETRRRRRFRLALGADVRTERDAIAAERRAIVALESKAQATGVEVEGPRAAFSGFVDFWISNAVDLRRKPSTAKSYRNTAEAWLVPYFGDRDISTITRLDVETLQAWIRKTPSRGRSARGRIPAPKTANNIIGVLSSMLSKAVEWGYMKANPVDGVEPLAVDYDSEDYDWYNAEQADAWLEKCAEVEPDWYPICLAAFRTGARWGELFALEWDDVDFVSSRIRIRHSIAHKTTTVTSPKSRKARTVPMSPQLSRVLWTNRHLRGPLVFCDRDGNPLTLDMLKRPWARVTRAAGLPTIRHHDARHSFASQLSIAGAPLKGVQQLLGHSEITTTMRYAHLQPDAETSMVARLDGQASGHTLATPSLSGPGKRRRKPKVEMEAAGVEPADIQAMNIGPRRPK